MDDIDFKAKVTRAEFEELCTDLFERVPGPVLNALTAAEMKLVCILSLSLQVLSWAAWFSRWQNKIILE